jgi:ribA/ribD-fused uncharacterized protein
MREQLDRTRLVFFWHGPFSQWSKAPMVINGIEYVTCEQYMMAEKARLFGDAEAEAGILASQNPRVQKGIGRKVRGFDEAVWAAARDEIVYRGNLAKFTQHNDLREMLLDTGDRIIAEASPRDSIWGIGMAEDGPHVTDTSRWGLNLLGKALMRVRETLLQEQTSSRRSNGDSA